MADPRLGRQPLSGRSLGEAFGVCLGGVVEGGLVAHEDRFETSGVQVRWPQLGDPRLAIVIWGDVSEESGYRVYAGRSWLSTCATLVAYVPGAQAVGR